MLEAELAHMKQKILRLNEIAEQFMQTPEVVESAFTAATTGAHRALNDLNHNIIKKVDDIFEERISHKGTLTNLFGLNKTIEKREQNAAPTRDNQVQTVGGTCMAHT